MNILVVAYLAIAPGMNVEAFIHSVNLCAYTAPQFTVEVPAAHCAHNHGCPTQDDTPEETESCPHLCQAVAPANAMPAMQVQSFDQLASPAVNVVSSLAPVSVRVHSPLVSDSRPPPGPELVATTILVI